MNSIEEIKAKDQKAYDNFVSEIKVIEDKIMALDSDGESSVDFDTDEKQFQVTKGRGGYYIFERTIEPEAQWDSYEVYSMKLGEATQFIFEALY